MTKKKAQKAEPLYNPEQQQVVDHVYGPLRVVAVAGSGKTAALIGRTVQLLRKGAARPDQILLISFSVAARKQMEKRLSEALPGVDAERMCRTFHSIGLDIFRREHPEGAGWRIDESGRLWSRALGMAMGGIGMKFGSDRSAGEASMTLVKQFASRAKNEMLISHEGLRRLGQVPAELRELATAFVVTAPWIKPDDLVSILHAAEDIRTQGRVVDAGVGVRFVTFDDMLSQAAMLLRDAEVRARWASRWRFVMQDEAQDESEVQAEIAEHLCADHRNYMVVGDPAQAIYAFRGSRPEKILNFDAQWPGTKTVVMHRNYRSGIDVIDVANKTLALMPPETVIPGVQMHSERQTRAYVEARQFRDSREEAEAIVNNCIAHEKQGVAFKEQAVLVRMNFMTRDIELMMARREVPYRLVSGTSFFTLRESAALFAYLRLATHSATADDVTLALSFPGRGVGKAFTDKVVSAYDQKIADAPESSPSWHDCVKECLVYCNSKQHESVSLWLSAVKGLRAALRSGHTPYQALSAMAVVFDLKDWLLKKGADDGEDNRAAENYEAAMSYVSEFSDAEALLAEVDKVTSHRKRSTRSGVTISTVHKAKGLEWPVVYLARCEDGLFPVQRRNGVMREVDMAPGAQDVFAVLEQLNAKQLREERRLFYVAVTRAQDELWVSCTAGNDEANYKPSRFIEDVGLSVLPGDEFEPGRQVEPLRVGSQLSLI